MGEEAAGELRESIIYAVQCEHHLHHQPQRQKQGRGWMIYDCLLLLPEATPL